MWVYFLYQKGHAENADWLPVARYFYKVIIIFAINEEAWKNIEEEGWEGGEESLWWGWGFQRLKLRASKVVLCFSWELATKRIRIELVHFPQFKPSNTKDLKKITETFIQISDNNYVKNSLKHCVYLKKEFKKKLIIYLVNEKFLF